MADHATERLLSDFADHLLKNRLADERHGRFMVNWVRRFFEYLFSAGCVANGRPVLTNATFQNFIAHLATRLHVASSTQNQAFASVLFL